MNIAFILFMLMRRSERMKKEVSYQALIFSIVFFLFLLFPCLLDARHYKYIHEPEEDIYFGHISYTELKNDAQDPVVLREGRRLPEAAVLNLPLAPGDTIVTFGQRRCEIQFDTGTIIRLDVKTELTIETVLAQSLSSWDKVTNLILHRGQVYIMYTSYGSRELFQVKTPFAAVKIKNRTVASIKATEDSGSEVQVKAGKVLVMYGPDEDSLKEIKVKPKERLIITADHQAQKGVLIQDGDFEKWNKYINDNFAQLHRGKAFVPEPILRYPPAVVYFARKYSNIYGEWAWDDYFGWVWKPAYYTYYPSGLWQPYYYGMWREIGGNLFWVPEEPWGWVPYHLGVWHWNKKLGWVWIPGSAFAPAWVYWGYFSGFYSWRPWTLWDWSFSWYNPYSYEILPSLAYLMPARESESSKPVLRKISKKQMQKKSSSYPLRGELRNAYKNIISALKKKDASVVDSFWAVPRHFLFVKDSDLDAPHIQNKIITSEKFLKEKSNSRLLREGVPYKGDAFQAPVRAFIRNLRVKELRSYVIPSFSRTKERIGNLKSNKFPARMKRGTTTESKSGKTHLRGTIRTVDKTRSFNLVESKARGRSFEMNFRDWNSDIRAARKIGVSIFYSSRTNEIRCPELNISSRTVVAQRGRSPSRSGFRFHPSSVSSGSSSVSSSSSGSTSSGRVVGSRGGGHSRGSVSKGGSGSRVNK